MDDRTGDGAAGPAFEDLGREVADLLTSSMVADSLDAVGFRHQVMVPAVTPCTVDARIFGRASTAHFVPTQQDGENPYGDAMAFIDSLEPGSVPVIATGGDQRTAYWGELFSAAAMGRGAVGSICDGPVRDVGKIRALGYSVFSAGRRPVDFRARMEIAECGTAVRCGGVHVQPGDLVLADEDGVVVIPRVAEQEVLTMAVSRARAESNVLDELLGGARLADVWRRWGVL